MNARNAAFISIKKYISAQKYLNIEIDATIKKYSLDGAEKHLYTALVYGSVERMITLDYIISRLSNKPIEQIDENVLIILRLGIYQLMFCDRIPEHAVCSEAGEMCRRFAAAEAVAFVNAILREYIRKKDMTFLPEKKDGLTKYLSVRYSVPEWMISLWIKDYGEEKCQKILAALDGEPPYLTLRTNTLRAERGELLELLAENSVKARAHARIENAVELLQRISFEHIDAIAPGAFFVQDAASQIAVSALGAKPEERIIDVCAAPGSKSFGAALDMGNRGEVLSFDLHANKISLIKRGADALSISCIEARAGDASKPNEALFEYADRVICDVPCSGLGVIAKKPDIRYKDPEDIVRLPDIQKKIINNCAQYVKRGGILLYSTCTLRRAENEDVIEAFLSSHPDFALEPFEAGGYRSEGMLTLFPDKYVHDGFFVAKLRRSEA